MTRAEAAVALALTQGRSLDELAKAGPSLATLRVHLRRAFRKTATARQADLVRVLMTLPPRAAAETE
jgi:DNA-binding CsgD family transcriptional regulator